MLKSADSLACLFLDIFGMYFFSRTLGVSRIWVGQLALDMLGNLLCYVEADIMA